MKRVSKFLKNQFQLNEELKFVASITNKPIIIYVVTCVVIYFTFESIGGAIRFAYIGLVPWIGYHIIFYLIHFLSSELIITNERVLGKSGLIARKTVEIPLSRGEGLIVGQSILGRIFNYGTISNSGTGTTRVSMIFLNDPFLIRRKILETKSQLDNKS